VVHTLQNFRVSCVHTREPAFNVGYFLSELTTQHSNVVSSESVRYKQAQFRLQRMRKYPEWFTILKHDLWKA